MRRWTGPITLAGSQFSCTWLPDSPLEPADPSLYNRRSRCVSLGVVYNSYIRQEGAIKMDNTRSPVRGYALVAILGAVGGGFLVALVTNAIPKMMSKLMSGMMQNMMGQMRDCGLNPAEM